MRIDKLVSNYKTAINSGAYIAIVNSDGTVDVSHQSFKDFTLPNKKALDTWITENNLDEHDFIRVIIVDSEGKHPDVEPPIEL